MTVKPRIWLIDDEWVCADLEYACVLGANPFNAYNNWYKLYAELVNNDRSSVRD